MMIKKQIILITLTILAFACSAQTPDTHCYSQEYMDSINALIVDCNEVEYLDNVWKDNFYVRVMDGRADIEFTKTGYDLSIIVRDLDAQTSDTIFINDLVVQKQNNDSLINRIAFLESVINAPIENIKVRDSLNLNIYRHSGNVKVNVYQEDIQKRWYLWVTDETEMRVGQGNTQEQTWLPDRKIIKY